MRGLRLAVWSVVMVTRPARTKLEAALLRCGLALGAALVPVSAYAEAGGASSNLSVSAKVAPSCVIDTQPLNPVRARGGVSVSGALELGCSGSSPARVTLSGDSASRGQLGTPAMSSFTFEGTGVRTLQPVPEQLITHAATQLFVNVNF